MRFSVVHPSDLGSAEVAEWHSLISGNPAIRNPFLSYEFARAVGRYRPTARVLIIEDGPRVAGILAFERSSFGVGTPIGGIFNNTQAMICLPEFQCARADLLRAMNVSTFEFRHWLPETTPFPAPRLVSIEGPAIDLSNGFDAYLEAKSSQSKKFFKTIAYKQRKLARDVGEISIEYKADPDLLTKLMEWKSSQYRRSGWRDALAPGWIRELIRDIARIESPGLSGVTTVIRVDGRPAAIDVSLMSGSVFAGWLGAHDVELSRYSPGMIRNMETLRHVSHLGIERVELGGGDEDYKRTLANCTTPYTKGWFNTPSVGAAIHRMRRIPVDAATDFILSHPAARSFVRQGLRKSARLRGQ